MEANVGKWLKARFDEDKVASQVPLKQANSRNSGRLDLVAYDKKRGVFWVVECKPARTEVEISKAFAQARVYRSMIERSPDEFVDSASDGKLEMRFQRLMEATDRAIRIRVEFYVALKEKTCGNVSWIRNFKGQYPEIGVIRYKQNGTCRSYLRYANNRHDSELARAITVTIPIKGIWAAPHSI